VVIRVTPLVPAVSAFQLAAVPMPTADTIPIPVTTTRLVKRPPWPRRYFLPLACPSM
jgi:hypothetical protein